MKKYIAIGFAVATIACGGTGSPTSPLVAPAPPAPVPVVQPCQANQTGMFTLKNATTQGLYVSIDGVARGSLSPGGTSAANVLPVGSHAFRLENHLGYKEWLCSGTVNLNACDDKIATCSGF
jgi:hypothetical protein